MAQFFDRSYNAFAAPIEQEGECGESDVPVEVEEVGFEQKPISIPIFWINFNGFFQVLYSILIVF